MKWEKENIISIAEKRDRTECERVKKEFKLLRELSDNEGRTASRKLYYVRFKSPDRITFYGDFKPINEEEALIQFKVAEAILREEYTSRNCGSKQTAMGELLERV